MKMSKKTQKVKKRAVSILSVMILAVSVLFLIVNMSQFEVLIHLAYNIARFPPAYQLSLYSTLYTNLGFFAISIILVMIGVKMVLHDYYG